MTLDIAQYMKYQNALPDADTNSANKRARGGKRRIAEEENSTYELSAVVVHEGELQKRGHYVAYTKNPDGSWLYCSDEVIKEANEAEMIENMSKNGYMFFYTPSPVEPENDLR